MAKPPKPPAPVDRPHAPRYKGKGQKQSGEACNLPSMTISALIQKAPNEAELNEAYREIDRQESDRATAIVAASYVQDVLRFALSNRFVALSTKEYRDLFNFPTPLSSFSALIKVSYAVGLCAKPVRDDLEIIRDIRNGFAHAMIPVTFNTQEIKTSVDKLCFIQSKIDSGERIFFFGGVQEIGNPWRQKYVKTSRVLMNELMSPIFRVPQEGDTPHG